MSQVAASTEPGWRPDPSGRYEWRYWDGGWTNRVANSRRRDGCSRDRARPPPPATPAPPATPSPAADRATGAAPSVPVRRRRLGS